MFKKKLSAIHVATLRELNALSAMMAKKDGLEWTEVAHLTFESVETKFYEARAVGERKESKIKVKGDLLLPDGTTHPFYAKIEFDVERANLRWDYLICARIDVPEWYYRFSRPIAKGFKLEVHKAQRPEGPLTWGS